MQVFFASRSIRPGDDFTEAIPAGLDRCSVLLAVIGANWLTVTDGSGRPRIELDDDWVREEIRIALRDGLRVVAQRPHVVAQNPKFSRQRGSLLDEVRCETACRLLENTTLPVAQVALMLGYSEVSAFARSFKRRLACGPGAWRASRGPGISGAGRETAH